MSESAVDPAIALHVLAHAPMVVLIVDDSEVVVQANAFAAQVFGTDVTGKPVRSLFVDFTHNLPMAAIPEHDSTPRPLTVQTAKSLPQTLYFIWLRSGKQVAWCGKPDWGEMQRLQEEVLLLNNELSNLTRELQKANEALSRLNELKNRFLGMASHDLRKPLGLVMIYSEAMLDELGSSISDQHRQFLQKIQASSTFMKRMVDDFLDVAIIESGHLGLQCQSTDIMDVIHRAVTLVEVQAKRRKIDIEVKIVRPVPPLRADDAKLEQVVFNLVGNAVEHSPAGTQVHVLVDRDPSMVTVSVSDEGPGIPPEILSSLFETYVRGGSKKASGERSTGLGLAIARKIVPDVPAVVEID